MFHFTTGGAGPSAFGLLATSAGCVLLEIFCNHVWVGTMEEVVLQKMFINRWSYVAEERDFYRHEVAMFRFFGGRGSEQPGSVYHDSSLLLGVLKLLFLLVFIVVYFSFTGYFTCSWFNIFFPTPSHSLFSAISCPYRWQARGEGA